MQRMDRTKLAEAKKEYIQGRGSIREIAYRLQMPEAALQQYASRNDWAQDRENYLTLKPLNDFQTTLAVWRSRSLDLLEKCEETIKDSLAVVAPENTKGIFALTNAATRLVDCWREVAGIPRIAPIKTDDKKEKSIPAETEPIESQATDNQPDKQ